jgi:two-component sensor histidine kinase
MLGDQGMTSSSLSRQQLLLVEELQHRVANEYAIAVANLNHRARTYTDPIRTILAETSEQLRKFAEIHRVLLMPRAEGDIDLGEYLRNLCLTLTRASLADRGLSLLLYETPIPVEAHRAWRVGLVVAELVTNAVRHGSWRHGGGIIKVEILSRIGDIQCRVSDNGGGSENFSPGRGTDIVESLSHELGGCIRRELTEHGFTVLLTFPHRHSPN